MRTVILTALLLLACTVLALPAAAQPLNPLGGPSGQAGGIKPPPEERKATIPAPAAVPGAKARPDSVTPSTRGITDLPPTEALFDAINRGDIVTARDAINRGADLDSTNLLGLTPIELSVDLGRNDISFLLLSLRGGTARSATQQTSTSPPPAADRRTARRATPVTSTATATREAPAPAMAPKLFAGDGGSAVPSAGFLGFDARR